jgi:hypothetical protein
MTRKILLSALSITVMAIACGSSEDRTSAVLDAGNGGQAGAGGANATGGTHVGEPPPPAGSCTSAACAFPGAEGFATDTKGGRGGRVLIVTNLNADGPGSFKAALLTAEPRIIEPYINELAQNLIGK